MIPSDINLEVELPSTSLVVVADGTQLLQVLLNLATNAKDAMPGGGVLAFVCPRTPKLSTRWCG